MKLKNKIISALVLSLFIVSSFVLSVCAADGIQANTSPSDASVKVILPEKSVNKEDTEALKHTQALSHAMEIIKRDRSLIKTTTGQTVNFDYNDFAEFAQGGVVKTVTVLSVPEVSDGVLRLGALDAYAGQSISPNLISRLSFQPAYKGSEAEFTFSVNGDDGVICRMYSLRSENEAPNVLASSVYTKSGVTVFSSIKAEDPEGDSMVCSVITQPSHGLLKIDKTGAFSYKPDQNYTGVDAFVCQMTDKYGNVSSPVTVKLNVERNRSGVVYTDIAGTEAEYPAYLLAENGIFVGSTVADSTIFEPDKTVSRADFIVMAMKAAGYSPNVYSPAREGFADAAMLSDTERGYVVTAMSAGVLQADEYEGVKLIRPSSAITVSEAEQMVSAILGEAKEEEEQTQPLTRSDAAIMLARIIDSKR